MKAQFNILDLGPNSIVLIDTNSVYELLELSNDLEIRILTYHREFIKKLAFKFNKLNAYKVIRTEFRKVHYTSEQEFSAIWRNVENMAYYITVIKNAEEYTQEILESFFSALIYQLSNIVARDTAISKDKMSRYQEIVLQFINLVSEFYLKEKKVDFYAQKMMISTRHLSSVLKGVTGKSAGQIINEYIINEAKALLSTSSESIKEIAIKLKFSDQYAFSHFFKKHQNVSPREYRAQF
jgi:AraC-like DNA-binding protein